MKRIGRLWLLLAAIYWVSSVAQPPSYPLVCRGGGSMVLAYGTGGTGQVSFERAPRGAGAASPAPGQCAWLDRPLNSKEPLRLVYLDRTLDPRRFTLWFSAATAPRPSTIRAGETMLPRQAVVVLEGVHDSTSPTQVIVEALAGNLFYVQARNENTSLYVTRFGP